uniref:U-box domain-containing protein n=1 Tax=Arcella intermedia TaxID=1963864 RepID=A0A6B2LRJ2_9EUKA
MGKTKPGSMAKPPSHPPAFGLGTSRTSKRPTVEKSEAKPSLTIPPSFICPITQQIMEDPVIAVDGHSYEREAIIQWIKQRPDSPISRVPLSIEQLKPNNELKAQIMAWKKDNPTK